MDDEKIVGGGATEGGKLPPVPDFAEYQAYVKSIEADLNKKFGNIGYACFIFRKEKGADTYSTLISNAADKDRVIEIIRPYVKVADTKEKVLTNKSKVKIKKKLRRLK